MQILEKQIKYLSISLKKKENSECLEYLTGVQKVPRFAMHHGTVLGNVNKKPVPKNSRVMHCQCHYSQASNATLEWRINRLALVSIYEIEVTLFYQHILSTNTEYSRTPLNGHPY